MSGEVGDRPPLEVLRLVEDAIASETSPRAGAVVRAAKLLDEGALLAHPTATVYGLGGRARPEIDEEIARLKGRHPSRPMIRIAAGLGELEAALPAARWTPMARGLASRFWPGPLTLVLDDGSETGVAVRVESHAGLRAVLAAAGGVMTSTSLNRTGEPPVRSGGEAIALLAELGVGAVPVAVLDGGELSAGPASTIVSLRGGVSVLRRGAISARALASAIEELGGGLPGPDEGAIGASDDPE